MSSGSEFYWLGIDFGTSGARAIAINAAAQIVHEQSLKFTSPQTARQHSTWKATLFQLLHGLPASVRSHLSRIAINGTSATVLLCTESGEPLLPPLMYDDACDRQFLDKLQSIVPPDHCVLSVSSSLVKLLAFQTQPEFAQARFFLHQADWLGFLLHGQLGVSDYHNCLKLGYDPAAECYPDWFADPQLRVVRSQLPKVVTPGTILGPVMEAISTLFGLPKDCYICAGTTDSIAAFLASSAHQPGEAVTSLGSTLVLKLLSIQRVDSSAYGIYSHRLGSLWLVGGASNTGGAILSYFFTPEELSTYSQAIDPEVISPLQYYPLLKPGERFPVNNPDLPPCLTPRLKDPVEFLHGLLESLARIEAQGYTQLAQYGATPLQKVFTAGGGAKNGTWRAIRQRRLNVPVLTSFHGQAAYGTALLAMRGLGNAVQ